MRSILRGRASRADRRESSRGEEEEEGRSEKKELLPPFLVILFSVSRMMAGR